MEEVWSCISNVATAEFANNGWEIEEWFRYLQRSSGSSPFCSFIYNWPLFYWPLVGVPVPFKHCSGHLMNAGAWQVLPTVLGFSLGDWKDPGETPGIGQHSSFHRRNGRVVNQINRKQDRPCVYSKSRCMGSVFQHFSRTYAANVYV